MSDLAPLPEASKADQPDDFVIKVEGLRSQFGDHVVHEDLDLNVRR
ncbi:MAG: ABC-type transporter Mla maintaining outer membrane lipid asymmetry ATPase subunit MlaF, partial [Pseudoalteromonas distincta]